MKQHRTKFDDHPLKLMKNRNAGLPENHGLTGHGGKVRKGATGEGKTHIPESILQKIDEKWKSVMFEDTGYESYDAMRAGINKELGRKFG